MNCRADAEVLLHLTLCWIFSKLLMVCDVLFSWNLSSKKLDSVHNVGMCYTTHAFHTSVIKILYNEAVMTSLQLGRYLLMLRAVGKIMMLLGNLNHVVKFARHKFALVHFLDQLAPVPSK